MRSLYLLILLAACTELGETEAVTEDDHDLPLEGQLPVPPAAECAERWTIPASTAAIANTQYMPYAGATGCTGSASGGAIALGNYLRANFPTNNGYGVYNCRSISGSSAYSLHSEGRAIDFMIPYDYSQYGNANNAAGDAVGNWLIENAEALGVQRVIWDRTIWDADDSVPKDHCVDISNPHWDHLHIELSWAGANQQTSWYNGGGSTPPPGQTPGSSIDPIGDYVIDSNNNANGLFTSMTVSPSWSSSTANSGYYNTGYWRSQVSWLGLDFADFHFLTGVDRCYAVDAWWPAASSHSPDTVITGYHSPTGQIEGWDASLQLRGDAVVDQRINGNRWNFLGYWNFSSGFNKIAVSRWNDSLVGYAVADAVKLTPSGQCAYTPSAGQVIIDDYNPNNTALSSYFQAPASWNAHLATQGWRGTYQTAPTAWLGLDFADFNFQLSQDTCYSVDAWWPEATGFAPDTYFLAYHMGGSVIPGYSEDLVELGRTMKDQRYDGYQWQNLGTWRFPAGWNKVSVDRWTETLEGTAVADAIRLTPSSACPNVCPDSDGDGTNDCNETCDNDPAKTAPGVCGCGVSDADSDGDGTANCLDACASDPAKTIPGTCGCGVSDADSDGDGTANCNETCDNDPNKTSPGVCGCGVPDADSDGDGALNCQETCDTDPAKTSPGVCGCGVSDVDSDSDGTANCLDSCPTDPAKITPGVCGCGNTDTDSDADGTADCIDSCPTDPDKITPGECGCGVSDADLDGDGQADCAVCGDGITSIPETCDDGGQLDGDGCDAQCQVEPFILDPMSASPTQANSVRLVAHDAAPGSTVAFAASTQLGTTQVPVCGGLTLPLRRPALLGTVTADAWGQAVLDVRVPAAARGTVGAVVAVDLQSCRVSGVEISVL